MIGISKKSYLAASLAIMSGVFKMYKPYTSFLLSVGRGHDVVYTLHCSFQITSIHPTSATTRSQYVGTYVCIPAAHKCNFGQVNNNRKANDWETMGLGR